MCILQLPGPQRARRRIVVDGPPRIAAMSGAAEAAFRKWYRTQSVAAVLCTGFLVVEKPVAMGPAAEAGVLALAAFTGACGWRLLRCTKQELVVLYQLYAVLCTGLCVALVYVVMMPAFRAFAFRAEGAAVADHHVAATFASLVYGCISAKATTCANTYGEAVVPIHKKRD